MRIFSKVKEKFEIAKEVEQRYRAGEITKEEAKKLLPSGVTVSSINPKKKGKTIAGKLIKGIGKVAGSAAKVALPAVAGLVAGPAAGAALGGLVAKLGDTQVGKIVEAVTNKGYVNTNSILQTVTNAGQSITNNELQKVSQTISKVVADSTGQKIPVLTSLTTTQANNLLNTFGDILENAKQTGIIDTNKLQSDLVATGNYTEELYKSLLESLNRQVNGEVKPQNNTMLYVLGGGLLISIIALLFNKKR